MKEDPLHSLRAKEESEWTENETELFFFSFFFSFILLGLLALVTLFTTYYLFYSQYNSYLRLGSCTIYNFNSTYISF